jgi:hypothetical protein
LPSRWLWPLASRSTKTSSAGFSESISSRNGTPEGPHGCPLSVTPKIRCGPWICFGVNRQYYERIGFWLVWINSPPDRWFCSRSRRCGRSRIVPHVQSSYSLANIAEVSQFRSRSAVS